MKRSTGTGRVGQRRQVVIPEEICRELDLKVGDFVEVRRKGNGIVILPKRLVDKDLWDALTVQETRRAKKGLKELEEGRYVEWKRLKKGLGL